MNSNQRIVVNITAQYIRTILNVCLSLIATRWILRALGQVDYGIYSVVAGTIAMLGFMTNALVTTTQRYIAFYEGKQDNKSAYCCFGNSVLLHLLIGCGILLILLGLEPIVVNHLLKIDAARLIATHWIYISASFLMICTIIISPYRALFIAKENIIFISIIDVLDYILKLIVALVLLKIQSCDKLILYGILMASISVINLCILGVYAKRHYTICHWVRWHEWDIHFIRELTGFATWTIYSAGCFMGRAQGIAILLNRFWGTIINAAYGLSLQVSTAISMLSLSILNAISPQIYYAEGKNDRNRVFQLSIRTCKFAFLLLALISIPLLFELTPLLSLWLGATNIPDQTTIFIRFFLIAIVLDQLTSGLNIAIQATGYVKYNALIINTIKLTTLLFVWLCLRQGHSVQSVMWTYLIIETFCAYLRIPYLHKTVNFQAKTYWTSIIKCLPSVLICISVCWLCVQYIHIEWRFILTFIISILFGSIAMVTTALNKEERHIIFCYLHPQLHLTIHNNV